jgi:hypothetical protein
MYRKPEVRLMGSARKQILGVPGSTYIESEFGATNDPGAADQFPECNDGPKLVTGECA